MSPTRAEHLRLLVLLALAGVLRLVALGDVPRGHSFDEASAVVEARCLRETGRDLHGEPWPFFVRDLDDWKPPEYLYGIALTGPLLGDDIAGARRYMALVGLATVAATWWLGRELFGRESRAPLLAAGLLAVSPWHLQYNRIVIPATSVVLVQTLAMAALLRAVRHGRAPAATPWLFLGGLLWGFEPWIYATTKLWVVLLGGALLVSATAHARRWPFSARGTAAAAAGFALTVVPFVVTYLEHREQVDLRLHSMLLLGRPGAFSEVVRSYLSHLSLDFLVLEGDPNQRHSPPGIGQLLPVELPLLLAGVVSLVRERAPGARLLVAWLALAPLLGAFVMNAPHASRTIVMLPALQLVAAAGALTLVRRGRTARDRRRLWLLLGVVTAGCAVLSARAILVLAPRTTHPAWWTPDVTRLVTTAGELADRERLGPVVFLPATNVTWVDWIYIRRLSPAFLQAHAAETAAGKERYDPYDGAGRFRFTGAACVSPGCAPVVPAPGMLVVQGPGDLLPPDLTRWSRLGPDDPAAKFWRVR